MKILFNPVGIKCNIYCNYCFHRNKNRKISDIISLNTASNFIQQYIKAFPLEKSYEFIWHGGEPLLAGIPLIENILNLQQKFLPPGKKFINGIQTNATILTRKKLEFLKENNFKVGISYDGISQLHNKSRKYYNGKGTHYQVTKAIELLNEYGLEPGIVLVVNACNKDYPIEIFEDLLCRRIKSVRLSPCIEYHKYYIENFSLKPLEFSKFVITLFDLWWKHDDPTFEIGYITDIIEGLRFGETPSCVLNTDCKNFLVFDSNGDVKSCEDISGHQNVFGNINENDLITILKRNSKYYKFYKEIDDSRVKMCKNCKWYKICKGGCPYNWDRRDNKNYLCEDNKLIFEYISNRLISEINIFIKEIKSIN